MVSWYHFPLHKKNETLDKYNFVERAFLNFFVVTSSGRNFGATEFNRKINSFKGNVKLALSKRWFLHSVKVSTERVGFKTTSPTRYAWMTEGLNLNKHSTLKFTLYLKLRN